MKGRSAPPTLTVTERSGASERHTRPEKRRRSLMPASTLQSRVLPTDTALAAGGLRAGYDGYKRRNGRCQ
jgi:hypothetical protein